MHLPRRLVVPLWLVVVLAGLAGAAQPMPSSWLSIEAPSELNAYASRVRRVDIMQLSGIQALIGVVGPGDRIHVHLVAEDAATARDTAPWIAGFADASRSTVVLFPERIGSYPYDSLESVLLHELSHVLAYRAAGGRPLPRWFQEGLATAAERRLGLGARSRLAWELLVGRRNTATELEGMFTGGPRAARRAYALSDAVVRTLLDLYGRGAVARIFGAMRQGDTFELALHAATGSTTDELFEQFWTRHQLWQQWVAWLGSPFTIWTLVTALSLVAIWRHRQRRAARRSEWEAEERAEDQAWEEHRRRYRIH